MFRPSFCSMRYHEWFDDFDDYAATDWVLTTIEGAGSATEVTTSARGGILLVTNGTADNDQDSFQWAGVDGTTCKKTFKYVAGKRLYFEIRFALSDVIESDFLAGLQIDDATPFDATDGIWFQKDDGDAFLDCKVVKNSTASTLTACATLVNATYVVAAFYYQGGTSIRAYINGEAVGSLAVTNAPDDEALAVSFSITNGTNAAKALSVDYIYVAEERDSP